MELVRERESERVELCEMKLISTRQESFANVSAFRWVVNFVVPALRVDFYCTRRWVCLFSVALATLILSSIEYRMQEGKQVNRIRTHPTFNFSGLATTSKVRESIDTTDGDRADVGTWMLQTWWRDYFHLLGGRKWHQQATTTPSS